MTESSERKKCEEECQRELELRIRIKIQHTQLTKSMSKLSRSVSLLPSPTNEGKLNPPLGTSVCPRCIRTGVLGLAGVWLWWGLVRIAQRSLTMLGRSVSLPTQFVHPPGFRTQRQPLLGCRLRRTPSLLAPAAPDEPEGKVADEQPEAAFAAPSGLCVSLHVGARACV